MKSVSAPVVEQPPLVDQLRQACGACCTWILDAFARLLALPVPKDVNQAVSPDPTVYNDVVLIAISQTADPIELELNDELVQSLVQTEEVRKWEEHLYPYMSSLGAMSVHKITPNILAKSHNDSEYATMEYVRANTRIPVPQPRFPHLKRWTAMDFIDATMLLACWDSLSWWMQLRIACTLRGYVRQLRALTGTRPGPVTDGIIREHSLFDDQERGPFASSTHFRVWCEFNAHSSWVSAMRTRQHYNIGGEGSDDPYPIMGGEWPLVFTHGDLHLGNIMLSKDGVLWVVDWAVSGFFPPWLESVGIQYSQPPASFERYRWFITGVYPEYENFWGYFMGEVHRGFMIRPPAP